MAERTFEIDEATARRLIVACATECDCPRRTEVDLWKQVAADLYDAVRGATRPVPAIRRYMDLLYGRE